MNTFPSKWRPVEWLSRELKLARRMRNDIRIGWASHENGVPSKDPVTALNAKPKRLLPLSGTRELGSHKGYGLGLAVEALCSALTESYRAVQSMLRREKRENNEFWTFLSSN